MTSHSFLTRAGLKTVLAAAALTMPFDSFALDPDYQLQFSTYLGGNRWDHARDAATDSLGNVILVGGTAGNFPVTQGAYDTQYNDGVTKGPYAGQHSGCDVFVAKFSPAGSLLWCTYVGGPNYDRAYAVEVDRDDNIIFAGRAGPDFPTTPGAFQTDTGANINGKKGFYGIQNAFVAKLSSDGTTLMWASYVGKGQLCRGVDLDAEDNVYVAFSTEEVASPVVIDWFATAFNHAYLPAPPGNGANVDVGVAKIAKDGSEVLWATWYGGNGKDHTNGNIRVDEDGYSFLTFVTDSTDLPVSPNGEGWHGGSADMHIAKFSQDGSQLLHSTYLGGNGNDNFETHPTAIDRNGNVFVKLSGDSSDILATPGAYSAPGANNNSAKVFKLTPAFDVEAISIIGGNDNDAIDGIAIDAHGRVLLAGMTLSANYPTTPNPYQSSLVADHDAVISVLDNDLSNLLYSTYMGGNNYDLFRGCHIDPKGYLYGAGATVSSDFPTLNAANATYGGSNDARWGNGDAMLVVFKDINLFTGDSDQNFLPDAWENAHFGATNQDPDGDADGDGASNRLEYLLGLNPRDAFSTFSAWMADDRTIRFYPDDALVNYELRWSTSLTQPVPSWNRLNLPASGIHGSREYALPAFTQSPFHLSPDQGLFFSVTAEPAY